MGAKDNGFFSFPPLAWQQLFPDATDLFPPATPEEAEKRLQKLAIVENWLQLQVQSVRWQVFLLEQQKSLLEGMRTYGTQKKPKPEPESEAGDVD